MYHFETTDHTPYQTSYSPREISELYCFDAVDTDTGNGKVVLTEDVDYTSFYYEEL